MTPPNLTVADVRVLRAIFVEAYRRCHISPTTFARNIEAFEAAEHRLNDRPEVSAVWAA